MQPYTVFTYLLMLSILFIFLSGLLMYAGYTKKDSTLDNNTSGDILDFSYDNRNYIFISWLVLGLSTSVTGYYQM